MESKLGVGTSFTITFPAASTVSEVEEQPPLRASREARVLVVDDEEAVLNVLSQMLSEHWVDVAETGEAGLKHLREDEYDVVIVDLAMPGMNGWQVAEATRELDPNIGIVLCTGWDMEIERSRLEGSPVDLVLLKPFGKDQVLDMIVQATELRDQRAHSESEC